MTATAALLAIAVFGNPQRVPDPSRDGIGGVASDKGKPPQQPYTETIPGTKATLEMVPIPGGSFTMGSPPGEKGRGADEGPPHPVTVRPFFMSRHEVTWEAFHVYLDVGLKQELADLNRGAAPPPPDAVTYPTAPYADETFGFGRGRQPTIAVTWHAAMEFARWLSQKTGKTYRLPTEAEWEYACRAGRSTAYSFGDAPGALGDHAWFAGNAARKPHPVGGKRPNGFGLHDMHGNVAEWVFDRYDPRFYAQATGPALPVDPPGAARTPHVVRGGSWKDKPVALRCAARRPSDPSWSKQDPQKPQSIWWHTEATEVGFRLVYVPDEYPPLRGLRSRITPESPDR
jgi:formylglycine-generating enzyme required for sulfatase activity